MVERDIESLGIDGAWLLPLRVIDTPGGAVMHMLRTGFPLQPGHDAGVVSADPLTVGEVYFSEVLPGSAKAWKRHMRQTQHFAVPSGLLGLVLWDDRPDSPTRGALKTLTLGRTGTYGLVRIPCMVWYGFTALNGSPAVICNCPDIPHDPTEGIKCPWDAPETTGFPFDWNKPFPV